MTCNPPHKEAGLIPVTTQCCRPASAPSAPQEAWDRAQASPWSGVAAPQRAAAAGTQVAAPTRLRCLCSGLLHGQDAEPRSGGCPLSALQWRRQHSHAQSFGPSTECWPWPQHLTPLRPCMQVAAVVPVAVPAARLLLEDLADAVADWNRTVGGDRLTLQPWLEVPSKTLMPPLPLKLLWHLPSFTGRMPFPDPVVCSMTCPATIQRASCGSHPSAWQVRCAGEPGAYRSRCEDSGLLAGNAGTQAHPALHTPAVTEGCRCHPARLARM